VIDFAAGRAHLGVVMKRSRSIRLVLLSSTGLLLLAGCDQPDPLARNDFFQSEQECAQANDASACRQALMDARQQHAQTAPAFASRDACEAKFGLENCAETRQPPSAEQIQPGEQQAAQSGGGSWFMPAMLGYMMGRTLGGPGFVPPTTGAQAPPQAAARAQPVYRDVNNTVYSGNQTLGRTQALAPPRPSPTVARGGFGRTGTGTVSS
jgi:uncharacterized protein YgiB involved in biofilm formation